MRRVGIVIFREHGSKLVCVHAIAQRRVGAVAVSKATVVVDPVFLASRDVGQHPTDFNLSRRRHAIHVKGIPAGILDSKRGQRLPIPGNFYRNQLKVQARPNEEKQLFGQIILAIGFGKTSTAFICTLGGDRKTDAQQEDQTGTK